MNAFDKLPLLRVLAITAALVAGFVVGSRSSEQPPPAVPESAPSISLNGTISATASSTIASPDRNPLSDNKSTEASPRSFREIEMTVRKSGKSPNEMRLSLMETLGRMKPEQLVDLLSAESDSSAFMRFDFQFAAKRLAELAPERAAELWSKTPSLRFQSESLLGEWARKEPRAFASWTLSLPKDAQRAAANALGDIASRSPDQFAAIAPLIANSPGAAAAARKAIDALATTPGSTSALDFAKSLPEGIMRTTALANIARMPGMNPAEHPEIVNAIASLPPEDAARLGRDLEERSRDRESASKAISALPQGPALDAALTSNFRRNAEQDAAKAAANLEQMKTLSTYPAAVRGFVEATASKDPAAAAEWALSITPSANDPSASALRVAALERVARELAERNPEEARKWLNTAPVTDREYFILSGKERAK